MIWKYGIKYTHTCKEKEIVRREGELKTITRK